MWLKFAPALTFGLISLAMADIRCHYCGMRQPCKIPYDVDITPESHPHAFINCTGSCVKFDGVDKTTNTRVVVRKCGGPDAERAECKLDGEMFKTTGTLCTCMTTDCNSTQMTQGSFSCILFAFVAKVLQYLL